MTNPHGVTGKDYRPPTVETPHASAYLGVTPGGQNGQAGERAAYSQLDLVTGQPIKQTAMERLAGLAKEAAVTMAGNLRDSTPFTREGMAKGLGTMAAELRGGLIDLQRLVVQAFPDSMQQEAVMGEIGIPTPGQVDREREVVQLEPAYERSRGR